MPNSRPTQPIPKSVELDIAPLPYTLEEALAIVATLLPQLPTVPEDD